MRRRSMEYQEYEINIHKLLYRVCRKWRKILIFAIIVAIGLASTELIEGFSVLHDEELFTIAETTFQREHDAWESKGMMLQSKIDTLSADKLRQEDYNEKSIFMHIDPMDEHIGMFSIYIDSGYMVDPTLSRQNLDFTDRILSAYNKYLSGGELYEYMITQTDLFDDQRFLKEIMDINVANDAAMITVSIRGKSSDQVNSLLNMVKKGIAEQYDKINETVHEHTYTIVNEIEYSYINYTLEDNQAANYDKIANINTQIAEINMQMEEWRAQDEPSFRYITSKVIKRAIKKAILGGIAGCIMAFVFLAAVDMFGRKFVDDKLSLCGGKNAVCLGTVNYGKSAEPSRGIDKLVDIFFGERKVIDSFETGCALAGSTVMNIAHAAKADSVALIGEVGTDLLSSLGSGMAASSEDCAIVPLGDILSQPAAVEALKNYRYVAIAASEGKSTLEDVKRQFELLKLWGKDVLGTVILR